MKQLAYERTRRFGLAWNWADHVKTFHKPEEAVGADAGELRERIKVFLGCRDDQIFNGAKDGYRYEVEIGEDAVIFRLKNFEDSVAKTRWREEAERMGGEIWRTNRRWRRKKRGREEEHEDEHEDEDEGNELVGSRGGAQVCRGRDSSPTG